MSEQNSAHDARELNHAALQHLSRVLPTLHKHNFQPGITLLYAIYPQDGGVDYEKTYNQVIVFNVYFTFFT